MNEPTIAQRPCILIAEDDALMRRLLHQTLTHEGFHVDVAENGEAALDLLRLPNDYRVVVSDLRMPLKDGEALLAEAPLLKPGIRLILISGYGEVDHHRSLVKKGAFDFLPKPFKIPDLVELIDRALEG